MIIATYVLLGLLVAAALWTVLTPTLLRSAIALALTSALLTLVMFQLDAPLAGVFELSVCAGLITVIFVSAIALTRPLEEAQEEERQRSHGRRFLPVLGVSAWVGVLLWAGGYALETRAAPEAASLGVREVLWTLRRLDLLGQIIVLFVGVFGVVILFKEKKAPAREESSK